jgi:hypothetical protein
MTRVRITKATRVRHPQEPPVLLTPGGRRLPW